MTQYLDEQDGFEEVRGRVTRGVETARRDLRTPVEDTLQGLKDLRDEARNVARLLFPQPAPTQSSGSESSPYAAPPSNEEAAPAEETPPDEAATGASAAPHDENP